MIDEINRILSDEKAITELNQNGSTSYIPCIIKQVQLENGVKIEKVPIKQMKTVRLNDHSIYPTYIIIH